MGKPVEDLEKFELGDPRKKVRVGSQLPQKLKEMLVAFLKQNENVFAWSHEDMLGIPPSVIVHKLSHRLVKQRRRNFASERNQAIAEEVQKLLQAGFIQEIDYPEW